jgi:hypothetical protein
LHFSACNAIDGLVWERVKASKMSSPVCNNSMYIESLQRHNVFFKIIYARQTMNKLKISQIKNRSAGYYAVGIVVFSAFFGILAVIMELVNRNS